MGRECATWHCLPNMHRQVCGESAAPHALLKHLYLHSMHPFYLYIFGHSKSADKDIYCIRFPEEIMSITCVLVAEGKRVGYTDSLHGEHLSGML